MGRIRGLVHPGTWGVLSFMMKNSISGSGKPTKGPAGRPAQDQPGGLVAPRDLPRRTVTVSDERIKIRCPNCQRDGRARAEHINRRVSCKYCEHVFRVTPVVEPESPPPAPSSPPPTPTPRKPGATASRRQAARLRIEGLEGELKKLRDDLSAQSAEQPAYGWAEAQAAQTAALREQLAGVQEGARKTETLLREAEAARARIERVLNDESEALRVEIARIREESRKTSVEHAAKEQSLLKEIAGLREQLDQTVLQAPDPEKGRPLEDELRIVREDLEQARDAAEARDRGHREALDTLQARHDLALAEAQGQLERATAEARAAEARRLETQAHRLEAEAARADLEEGHAGEIQAIRAERDAARQALDDHRADRERVDAERDRAIEQMQELLARAQAELGESGATREHRDRLAGELDGARARLEEVERLASEATARADQASSDRERSRLDHESEVQGLREELSIVRAGLQDSEATREQLEHARARLEEAEAARRDLEEARDRADRLAAELEAQRATLAEAEGRESEARSKADAILAEVESLREQLARSQAGPSEADVIRRERDEARIQRDRVVEELDLLRARVEEAERTATDWDFASTEVEVPRYQAATAEAQARANAEIEALRAELAETRELVARKDAVLADMAMDLALERDKADETARQAGRADAEREFAEERARVTDEVEGLRRSLGEALDAAEASARSQEELSGRLRRLEAAPTPTVASTPTEDAPAIEQARRLAVEEAVKGAWADFERRLSETQGKLKAANARADLLEAEAREAHDQIASFQKGVELGDISSFEEMAASMTSIRILSDRGTARITLTDAEGRLALARQLAVDRKDKPLIDRIAKMVDKVRDDLEARNYTLAETLVRGAEIEVGLDPGGYSINGLKIFRPSPAIVTSLTALIPAFERVMKQGDLASIRSTLGEMRTILGDQAGLPEIRRPGRAPAVKRPIAPAEAVRLFVGAIEAEQWLMRPIANKRPLPDTSLTTYASLMEACSEIRPAVEEHAPEKVELIDKIIQACGQMLTRRQQPDGHFPFLDPRGKPSKLATAVDSMVAQSPLAVKDGWVVAPDPLGAAQAENAYCGMALLKAGAALKRPEWAQAASRAADWAAGQPCLPYFLANALSAALLARAYLDAGQERHLAGLIAKLNVGLLPGQVENGRWIDAATAQTTNHLAILQALHDAWEAVPPDRGLLRDELRASLDRAAASLLEECKALGVPAQGGALRALVRHRDLTRPDLDPRLEPAILDSVTVVQELCHDADKPKLGVSPDLLATLARA
jgi:hypothetical protein